MNTTLIYVKEDEHLLVVASCTGCRKTERFSSALVDLNSAQPVPYGQAYDFALEHRRCLVREPEPHRAIPTPSITVDEGRLRIQVGVALRRIDDLLKLNGGVDYCDLADHAREAFVAALRLCSMRSP